MFHIVCRTCWLSQEVTEDVVTIIKNRKRISFFRNRLDAENEKSYLTRVAKRSKPTNDVVCVSFWVMTGTGLPKETENDIK